VTQPPTVTLTATVTPTVPNCSITDIRNLHPSFSILHQHSCSIVQVPSSYTESCSQPTVDQRILQTTVTATPSINRQCHVTPRSHSRSRPHRQSPPPVPFHSVPSRFSRPRWMWLDAHLKSVLNLAEVDVMPGDAHSFISPIRTSVSTLFVLLTLTSRIPIPSS